MVLELGDQSKIRNEANDLTADVEFKTKGYFTGTYNAIAGKVTRGGKSVGDLSGKWNEVMEYKHAKSGETDVLFDAKTANMAQKTVRPEEEQDEFESRRCVVRPGKVAACAHTTRPQTVVQSDRGNQGKEFGQGDGCKDGH